MPEGATLNSQPAQGESKNQSDAAAQKAQQIQRTIIHKLTNEINALSPRDKLNLLEECGLTVLHVFRRQRDGTYIPEFVIPADRFKGFVTSMSQSMNNVNVFCASLLEGNSMPTDDILHLLRSLSAQECTDRGKRKTPPAFAEAEEILNSVSERIFAATKHLRNTDPLWAYRRERDAKAKQDAKQAQPQATEERAAPKASRGKGKATSAEAAAQEAEAAVQEAETAAQEAELKAPNEAELSAA